ncbi:MAG: branched-chain amino acid ABC transporter ATP-binding protein/permease [Nocardioides sp.]|uniref:branched-chain amino acid ABC transporter ATP-binding protein/permease n=1 Tax=Nocardioides sp. TaxID=35761 RepID=UPI0039E6A361
MSQLITRAARSWPPKAAALVIVVVVLYFLPYTVNAYRIHVVDVTIIFAILAVGLGLAMGIGGQINLAQVAMFGIGAYAVAMLTTQHGYGFWVAAVLGVIASIVAGLVVGIPALRVQSHYLGIVTLGLALAFTSWVTNSASTHGADGISGIPVPPLFGVDLSDEYLYYYLEIVVFLITTAYAIFWVRTRLGRRMRAMRDDAIAAGALGANVPVLRMIAFGVASLYGGVAGVLYAGLIRYVAPDSFSTTTMFLLLAMVIIGGRQSIIGCVIGAVVLSAIREALVDASEYAQLGYGAVVVFAVVFAPTGLAGLPKRLRGLFGTGAGGRAELRQWSLDGTLAELSARPPAALRVDGVVKNFRGLRALDGVELDVPAGQIRGVVGPNGSGKTTLLNVISGLYKVDGGSLRLDDRQVTGASPTALSLRGVARTFQNLRLFADLTVRENILVALDRTPATSSLAYLGWLPGVIGHERRLRKRAETIMVEFGIVDYAEEAPTSLPYGIQRRIELARAIATNPRLLLLDEPAAGLNGQEVTELKEIVLAIRDLGVTVVMVEHNMGLVMTLCDQVTVLANGAVIADGEPSEVVSNPDVIEAYLGDVDQMADLVAELPVTDPAPELSKEASS